MCQFGKEKNIYGILHSHDFGFWPISTFLIKLIKTAKEISLFYYIRILFHYSSEQGSQT